MASTRHYRTMEKFRNFFNFGEIRYKVASQLLQELSKGALTPLQHQNLTNFLFGQRKFKLSPQAHNKPFGILFKFRHLCVTIHRNRTIFHRFLASQMLCLRHRTPRLTMTIPMTMPSLLQLSSSSPLRQE